MKLYSKDNYSFRNNPENVERSKKYSQVCVWTLTDNEIKVLELDEESIKDLLQDIVQTQLKCRYKYLEMFHDVPIYCSHGHKQDFTKTHILFAVHRDDIKKFAAPRFKFGIRWLEDATSLSNGYYDQNYFPKRVLSYRTWCADVSPDTVEAVKNRDLQ